jgi:hypothetical protein
MKKAGTLSICMFAAMLFLAAGAAEAANWQRISEYEDRIIYIDNDSIRHISQTITGARFKIELKEPSWVNLKSIDHYLIEGSIPHSLCCGETLNPLLERGFGGL